MTPEQIQALYKSLTPNEQKVYDAMIAQATINCQTSTVNKAQVLELIQQASMHLNDGSDQHLARQVANDWIRAKYFKQDSKIVELQNKYAGHSEIFTKVLLGASEGELIPTIVQTELIRLAKEAYWHRQLFRVIPIPGVQKTRWLTETAGIEAEETAENDTPTADEPTFHYIDVDTGKVAAKVYVPNELLRVAAIDLTGLLSQMCMESIMKKEFARIINGNGAGQWKGLNAYTFTEVDSNAGDIYDKVLEAVGGIPAVYANNLIWITSTMGWVKIYSIKDDVKRPYWIPPAGVMGIDVKKNATMGDTYRYLMNPKTYGIFDTQAYFLKITSEGDTLTSKDLALFYCQVYTDGKLLTEEGVIKTINVP
jgi:HK97 family phage major capsid protein